jgi:hypothetical protein
MEEGLQDAVTGSALKSTGAAWGKSLGGERSGKGQENSPGMYEGAKAPLQGLVREFDGPHATM